ncbi:hypothetical protein KEM48_007388 [Puccinia striiformis f. sp. tritici PST-130]|nr:hypothetical protein KEM48_007388 [Puccinia striiformis f. sp. tritici PST-130]
MRATTSAIFLAISLSAVKATVHTVCYNYFLQKDGCVFSAAAADQRCPAPPKEHPAEVQAFALNSTAQKVKRSVNKLERRYDTTAPSFASGVVTEPVAFTIPSTNSVFVYGTEPNKTILPSKLPDGSTDLELWQENVRQLPNLISAFFATDAHGTPTFSYIQRKGQPNTVQFVKVLDGCYFGATSPDPGCFDIGLTIKLFNAFNPTPEEQRDGVIKGGITWDFDNLHGLSPQQAPV